MGPASASSGPLHNVARDEHACPARRLHLSLGGTTRAWSFKACGGPAASTAGLAVLPVTWVATTAPAAATAPRTRNTALINGDSIPPPAGFTKAKEPISPGHT